MNCERFKYYSNNTNTKKIDQYFGNGMSLQTILTSSLCGVIIFNNLRLDNLKFNEHEPKDCLNRVITAEMVAKVDTEICKVIAASVAAFEYEKIADKDEEDVYSCIENVQNILTFWRFSTIAKIHSNEPILVKNLFILQSNAYHEDEIVQHEYSTNNTLYLLKDIIAQIDEEYPQLNFKDMLTAVEEIQHVIYDS